MKLLQSLAMFSMTACCGVFATAANANVLQLGDQLTITPGAYAAGVASQAGTGAILPGGSWFAVNLNGDSFIQSDEQVALKQGTTGIVVGQATLPGASHPGMPTALDTNEITAPWFVFGGTGSDYTTTGITGGVLAGLDFSGWAVTYASDLLGLGSGAWTPSNALLAGMVASGYQDGIGVFAWDGVYGHGYTLDYTATVASPVFGGIQYALHLQGVVNQVPEAPTLFLLGLGFMGLLYSQSRSARPVIQ